MKESEKKEVDEWEKIEGWGGKKFEIENLMKGNECGELRNMMVKENLGGVREFGREEGRRNVKIWEWDNGNEIFEIGSRDGRVWFKGNGKRGGKGDCRCRNEEEVLGEMDWRWRKYGKGDEGERIKERYEIWRGRCEEKDGEDRKNGKKG